MTEYHREVLKYENEQGSEKRGGLLK